MPNTREKLVELLKTIPQVNHAQAAVDGLDYVFGCAADYLIANGVTVQEWISVKDRLPEVGKKVLVYCKENKNDYEIGAYSDTYRGFFVRQTWYENITHWMPLPQPPKGE